MSQREQSIKPTQKTSFNLLTHYDGTSNNSTCQTSKLKNKKSGSVYKFCKLHDSPQENDNFECY